MLLLLVTSLASADYVAIIINLSGPKDQGNPAGPGVPGGGMIGGVPSPPGGMIGGRLQVGGMPNPPGGGMIGGRLQVGGMPNPPGGGMIGGFPGSGRPPGRPMGPPAPGGMQVGSPPAGMGGDRTGNVGGAFRGGMPSAPAADLDVDEDPHLVVVVVEVDPIAKDYMRTFEGRGIKTPFGVVKPLPGQVGGPDKIKVKHRWGLVDLRKKSLDNNVEVIFLKGADGKPLPTVAKRFAKMHEDLFKDKEKPTSKQLIDLAQWAFLHGLTDKFVDLMDKAAAIDKTNPLVSAYLKVKADLAVKPTGTGDAGTIRGKLLDGYKATTTDAHHYVLLHNLSGDAEVRPQLDRLEQSFRNFYYWWALRGVNLTIPRERQVAVLVEKRDTQDDRDRLRKHLNTSQTLADSFFARPRPCRSTRPSASTRLTRPWRPPAGNTGSRGTTPRRC